jgi:hypothetical protein
MTTHAALPTGKRTHLSISPGSGALHVVLSRSGIPRADHPVAIELTRTNGDASCPMSPAARRPGLVRMGTTRRETADPVQENSAVTGASDFLYFSSLWTAEIVARPPGGAPRPARRLRLARASGLGLAPADPASVDDLDHHP